MSTNTIILVGGGAFAREVIGWQADQARASNGPVVTAFIDDNPKALDGFEYGLAYLGTIADYQPKPDELLVMGIADPATKLKVAAALQARGGRFASVVHPTSVVAKSARIGVGVVVCPLALVSADARVGDFVAINAMSSIGHDAIVGAGGTLSAHVDLTGGVQVGDGCFFGTGAKVLPGVRIGERARIGAGALIMRTVQPDAVMYAAPAKKL
jgi:sugar O-acyltransferase (sialic acid O-acetyltransferase NeuD family)